ncbi:Protein IVY1 [Spathaspora sp. JA1]|nr:Protein IVY1 [Spathaspora sp. JA1]
MDITTSPNQPKPDILPNGSLQQHPKLSSASPPEHLSEFITIMNQDYNAPSSRQTSLNTYTSFSPSVLDMSSNDIITTSDFHHITSTYEKLFTASTHLQKALESVSDAANEFGQALERCIHDCPKVNNSVSVEDGVCNAAGLQYIMASNHQILGRLIHDSFTDPLEQELKKLKLEYEQNHSYYQSELKSKSKLLKEFEVENLKLRKKKVRNLNKYKHNLLSLTGQLDDIDRVKYDYYHEINALVAGFNREHLLTRTGGLVRAELEISESIARKGWNGGGLDKLLTISPDLFDSELASESIEEDRIDDDTIELITREEEEEEQEEEDEEEVDVPRTIEEPEEPFSLPIVSTTNTLLRRLHNDNKINDVIESF